MTLRTEPRHGGLSVQASTANCPGPSGRGPFLVVKTGDDFRDALASMKTLDELAGVDLAFEIAALTPSTEQRGMIATRKAELQRGRA